MHPKYADEIEDSVDPYQMWVCTVCSNLSVAFHKIFIVIYVFYQVQQQLQVNGPRQMKRHQNERVYQGQNLKTNHLMVKQHPKWIHSLNRNHLLL